MKKHIIIEVWHGKSTHSGETSDLWEVIDTGKMFGSSYFYSSEGDTPQDADIEAHDRKLHYEINGYTAEVKYLEN